MRLVVDSNVLIAALLKHSTTHHLMFSIELELYAPEHCKEEILKYETEFALKMGKTVLQVRDAVDLILYGVSIVPQGEYAQKELEAKIICASHVNDWPFVALALKMNAPIWINDAAFFKHSELKVFSTKEIIKVLNP